MRTIVLNTNIPNKDPQRSSISNKLDPHVNSETGTMTTRTSSGSSSDYSQSGVVPGSSTGAPAAPSTAASSNYNKNIPQQYNPATGTGYNPHGTQQQGSSSTANGNANVTTGTTGGGFGRRVERVLAGIHVSSSID